MQQEWWGCKSGFCCNSTDPQCLSWRVSSVYQIQAVSWDENTSRLWAVPAVDHRRDYDCSRSLSQKPSEACVLLPRPSALGSNQSHGIFRVLKLKVIDFPHLLQQMWNHRGEETVENCGFVCSGYAEMRTGVTCVPRSHPWKGTGCCLATTEGLAPSRQITQTAVTLSPNGWSPSCIQLYCNKHKTAHKCSK